MSINIFVFYTRFDIIKSIHPKSIPNGYNYSLIHLLFCTPDVKVPFMVQLFCYLKTVKTVNCKVEGSIF